MKLPIYEELKKEVSECNKCGLGDCENKLDPHILGGGNLNSKILFVAESPGEQEVIYKEPLTLAGRSGKQFAGVLEELRLKREDVYVANLIICHPPKNRNPHLFEINFCSGFLDRQVELVDPKLIVCFGRFSSGYFLGREVKITKEQGKLIKSEKFNKDIFLLPHFTYVSAYATQQTRQRYRDALKTLKTIIRDI